MFENCGRCLSKGVIFIFLIRPLAGMVSFIGSPLHNKEKLAISFFGIRGMGSFFYLAFALGHHPFEKANELWALISFIVLVSIVVHGISANTVMNKMTGKYKHIESLVEEEDAAKAGK